jgi:plastocyanin
LSIRSILSFVSASGMVLVLFMSTYLIGVSGASTAEVKIPQGVNEGGNHFEPETLKIGKGTTVKWTNEDDSISIRVCGS